MFYWSFLLVWFVLFRYVVVCIDHIPVHKQSHKSNFSTIKCDRFSVATADWFIFSILLSNSVQFMGPGECEFVYAVLCEWTRYKRERVGERKRAIDE